MFAHYLKTAFRSLRKHKIQSLTGIFGLAFGLACFIFGTFWIRYETAYDNAYPGAQHVYRVYSVEKQSGKVNGQVPGLLETKLHWYLPATETSAAFTVGRENYSAAGVPHIRLHTLYADSAFFRVFPQVFVSGGAQQPLQTKRHIILTESTAVRLFGSAENAVGQQVKSVTYHFPPYTVTAVVKDPPHNTNLPFDAVHFPEIQSQMTNYMPEEAQWTYFDRQLYIKLNPHTDIDRLAGQLRGFASQPGANDKIELRLLPISDVRHRLDADLPFTLGFIRLFVAAGLLLLFSAFFNFLNLHLGLFRQRIRELRQRNICGATGWQLVVQMTFELACAALLALLSAWCFVFLARPAFSSLLDVAVEMPQLVHQFIICGLATLVLILVAGLIPLWRLSRSALHDLAATRRPQQPVLRRVAVALQLAVSVVFIIATLVVMLQLNFVSRKDMGFDHRGIIQVSRLNGIDRQQQTAIDHRLAAIPQIESITRTSFEPQHEDHAMITEVEWPGKAPDGKPAFQSVAADSRFAETFGLELIRGEWWSEGSRQKVVLNEEAVRVMGLDNPVGAVIRMYPDYVLSDGSARMQEYEVAGVVNDFHTLSLRSRIHPAIFREPAFDDGILYIRVAPGREWEVMQQIAAFLPGIDASLADARLTALDELYTQLNRSEQAGVKMFAVLAAVCLLIALFGIHAVASGSAHRRRKEIAIRKVFGAAVGDIVRMFFREYAMQAVIAGAVALPLACFAMNRWLQGYAYHTDIPWWLLAAVVVAVVAVVLLTVLGQVLKAANSKPADVVKCE